MGDCLANVFVSWQGVQGLVNIDRIGTRQNLRYRKYHQNAGKPVGKKLFHDSQSANSMCILRPARLGRSKPLNPEDQLSEGIESDRLDARCAPIKGVFLTKGRHLRSVFKQMGKY